jgi:hypothetical protein
MKNFAIVALLGVLVHAAADARMPALLTTAKSTQAFADCFARNQDRQSAAWAFVPKAHGGTFSNLGAASVAAPYFLRISDRGERREIQLQNARPGGAEEKGVQQCI